MSSWKDVGGKSYRLKLAGEVGLVLEKIVPLRTSKNVSSKLETAGHRGVATLATAPIPDKWLQQNSPP